MTPLRRLLLALLLLAVAFGLRAPFLQRSIWNLDEGITITAAEQIRAGGVLYLDAADHRNPLVPYLKAAVFTVFGDWNTTAVHTLLALLLGLEAVALWQIARRLGDERTGMAAAAVFTVLCFLLPDGDDAMAAHTEWFVILFSTAGFLAFATALDRPSFLRGLGIGSLFGLAFLCKQPGLLDYGVTFVLLALLLLTRPNPRGPLLRLALGSGTGFALAVGIAVAYFAWHGALRDLAYYAWTYNSEVYVPAVPLHERLLTLREPFRLAAAHLPAVLALGLVGALLLPAAALRGLFRRPLEIRLLPWLALGWTAAGLIAASLGGRAFSHYSIQVMPGLSLVCGWVLVRAIDWHGAHHRVWRLAGLAVLTLAIIHSGRKIAARLRELEPSDAEWPPRFHIVRDHTRPEERIFVWGFTPDYYVHMQRRPCTRFLHAHFLTGMIVWATYDPLIETEQNVTPGSWAQLQEDFQHTPPAMIVDTGAVRGHAKYPLCDQPQLWSLIVREYAELTAPPGPPVAGRYYRRLEPATPHALPADAIADASVQLESSYTNQYPPIPALTFRAPADATRIDLYRAGRLHRSLALVGDSSAVSFFVPPEERPPGATEFRAAVHRPDGIHLGPPLLLPTAAQIRRTHSAPGPALHFAGRELQPVGSATHDGPPTPRSAPAGSWNTPANARLVYRRPPGLQAFTFTFGLDERVYFDTATLLASDGVDFAVDFVPDQGPKARLFSRRLEPRAYGADQGPQTGTVTFPDLRPGNITIQVLPGRRNLTEQDWAYLGPLLGSGAAYAPALVTATGEILADEVNANGAVGTVADPEGKWITHSPSALSYELPASAQSLIFSYGLEPASYDGSQGGRTDGITVTVTAERANGTSTTLFTRTLDPASLAGDQGRQTSRIELMGTEARRMTIAIGPGPNNNISFDWSYLADLRLETSAIAPATSP